MTAHDDGYALHEDVLPAAEVHALIRQIEALSIPRSRAGARHMLGSPPMSAVASDARLLAMAAAWLGAPALPFKAMLFDKNPDANWLVAWHQDTTLPMDAQVTTSGWGPWSTKEGIPYARAPANVLQRVIALRLHLDDSTPANGPLRVIPGTHLLGVLTNAQVHECAQGITSRECCVRAGGVVAMRPLIIHASSKSSGLQPRRVLHIEYAASLEVAPGMWLRAA